MTTSTKYCFTLLLLATLLLSGCSRDKTTNHSDQRTNALLENIKYGNPEESEQALHQLDSLSTTGTYNENVLNAYRTHIYFDRHQYRMAEYYATKAIKDQELRTKYPVLLYETYQYLVGCALDNGDYKKALNYGREGLDEARKDDTEEGQIYAAKFLSKIGQAQIRLNYLKEGFQASEEAYEQFKSALAGSQEFKQVYLWYSAVGEAIQHFVIVDVKKAIEWLPRLEETYNAACRTKDIPPSMADYCLSKLELTKAEVYAKTNQRKEAQEHFAKYQQTKIAQSGNDWISPMGYFENMGDKDRIYAIYNRWEQLCKTENIPFNKEMLQMLSMKFQVEMDMNKRTEALQTAQRIITNLEHVDSLTMADDAAQLAVIYETQEKEAKIAEQDAAITHQRLLYAVIAFILMVTFFVIFIYFRHRAAKRLEKAHQELQSAYEQLEETTTAKERIESELRIARDIQMSMVPHIFPQHKGLDLYASMQPAREVGGDLYDYLLEDDMLYFCVGDVSGKGVPASLFMAQAIRLFRALAKQRQEPAAIATRLNNELTEKNDNGMFVTMFIGLVNLNTGHLSFCNAGHNPPIIGGDEQHGSFMEMEPNAPIGLWHELDYIGEEIDCIFDHPLFVYTDGLNEAEDLQQQQFGDERLLDILRHTDFENSRQVIEHLAQEVNIHRHGAEPNDDLTMLCLKVNRKSL